MNKWRVEYLFRGKRTHSKEFDTELEAFNFIDELENEIGGFADFIYRNGDVAYSRYVDDTEVWWHNNTNGLSFE